MEKTKISRGIDHIGITVPNVNDASDFLVKAFDAEVLYDVQPENDKPMEGKLTEQQLGIPKGAKIVHMRLVQIGESATIELFEFENTNQNDPAKLNDYGLQHFCLYTDDIETAAKQFEIAGGELLSKIHPLTGVEDAPRNKGVYGKTPWGSLVELITYPDGLTNPKLHRWTPEK
ncbi:VOC family protein [Epilithonimonas sp.]|uniref:VOC family protein n=1 Tax=Epilithonimonas sp. TaxID=2894511 RepID=UPI0028A0AB77|nr:VOC family protein [Epilithonimonas sp.]